MAYGISHIRTEMGVGAKNMVEAIPNVGSETKHSYKRFNEVVAKSKETIANKNSCPLLRVGC